ncbi:MAG: hybrid sensor histidine kinase/response regulator [Opitutales bacterium]|nr:hybrid sensor histidine kinase/response regulator [Opitutales bacterium]
MPQSLKTILLIDDDQAILSMFGMALRHDGYQVLTADNGEEGIQLARTHLPDLIISDINMPGTDGKTVLKTLREDPAIASLQIVLMTGNPTAVTPRKGMELGADDFLIKPFGHDELTRCVEARLRRAHIHWRLEDKAITELRSTLHSTLPHEFFTPLAGILGLTELLRSDFREMDPAEVDEFLGEIEVSGWRLHRTLKNYLYLLDLKSGEEQEKGLLLGGTAAHEIIEDRIQTVAKRHKRESDIQSDLELSPLFAGSDSLAIMIEELVDNACSFSRKGTSVQVMMTKDGVFSVLDQGRGMTREQIKHLSMFRQFDRNTYEQQGLGLGMVLVMGLADRFGAELDISSTPGKGTKVTVKFKTEA